MNICSSNRRCSNVVVCWILDLKLIFKLNVRFQSWVHSCRESTSCCNWSVSNWSPTVLKHLVSSTKMPGFTKRGLPHTFSSINLEDHILIIKGHTKQKFSLATHLCWCFLLTKFQVSSINQEASKVLKWIRPLFTNSVTNNGETAQSRFRCVIYLNKKQ